MFKKIFSGLMALSMMSLLLIQAHADSAGQTMTFTLTCDAAETDSTGSYQTAVVRPETGTETRFSVSYYLSCSSTADIAAVQNEIYYDSTYLTLVSFDTCEGYDDYNALERISSRGDHYLFFNTTSAHSYKAHTPSQVGVFTFKVNTDKVAGGETTWIRSTNAKAYNSGYSKLETVCSDLQIKFSDTPHEVILPSPEHGSVSASSSHACKGEKVKLTVKPDDGYKLQALIVRDANGATVLAAGQEDGTYAFTMPATAVTVSASFVVMTAPTIPGPGNPITFSDVEPDSWYAEAVGYVAEKGLMNGYSKGVFAPDDNLSRGMLAQILYNHSRKPKVTWDGIFKDVAKKDWYADAVIWCAQNGVVNGNGNGEFEPEAPVTRQDMVVMLYRYARLKGSDVSEQAALDAYRDAASVSGYAAEAMAWAVQAEIINGVGDDLLDPQGTATRAQVAAVIMRYCKNLY